MTTTTASETTAPAVELSELDAFKDQVLRVAFHAKEAESWCDFGFNRTMTELGFRPVTKAYVEPVYGPDPELRPGPVPKPTLRPGMVSDCPDTCAICYNNPRSLSSRRPIIAEGYYEYRYADEDGELVTFADGSKPDAGN